MSDRSAERGDGNETVSGAEVVAQALKTQDVGYMFGIVGIPVTEVAAAAQKLGIRYVGMRNEQAVSVGAPGSDGCNGGHLLQALSSYRCSGASHISYRALGQEPC